MVVPRLEDGETGLDGTRGFRNMTMFVEVFQTVDTFILQRNDIMDGCPALGFDDGEDIVIGIISIKDFLEYIKEELPSCSGSCSPRHCLWKTQDAIASKKTTNGLQRPLL